jgi:hypothetical protein
LLRDGSGVGDIAEPFLAIFLAFSSFYMRHSRHLV